MTFPERIDQTITAYSLIRAGDTIVGGISGGADSSALLECLALRQNALGLKIIAAHVHHGLRPSADNDMRFVEQLCEKKGIPFESIRVQVSKKAGRSIEETAREQRFNALIKIAKKYHADSIALAHHQDDLAETVLMRLIRGTGLHGLQAILPKREINGICVIRPFIHVTRQDIETFLAKRKLSYRTDPTNTDQTFARNKIRHHLMPLLKKHYNPGIVSVLAGLAETSGLDYDLLSLMTKNAFHDLAKRKSRQKISFTTADLNQLHPAVLRALFRHAIAEAHGNTDGITLAHIRAVEALLHDGSKTKGIEIHLPHGITVMKQKKTLSITSRK